MSPAAHCSSGDSGGTARAATVVTIREWRLARQYATVAPQSARCNSQI